MDMTCCTTTGILILSPSTSAFAWRSDNLKFQASPWINCEHGIPTAKCGQSGGEHEQGEPGRWLLPIRHPPAGQGTGWPPSGGFGSLRTTTMVNLETSAEIAPIAARSGARMAPTAAI